MASFPHRYTVACRSTFEGDTRVASEGAPELTTAPPPQFGGPGGAWSPETLLAAAAADCLALTFRAMATASKLAWRELRCDAEGTVDRVDGVTRFTALGLKAELTVPPGTDPERARRILKKAERGCLVTRSLAFEATLETEVAVAT